MEQRVHLDPQRFFYEDDDEIIIREHQYEEVSSGFHISILKGTIVVGAIFAIFCIAAMILGYNPIAKFSNKGIDMEARKAGASVNEAVAEEYIDSFPPISENITLGQDRVFKYSSNQLIPTEEVDDLIVYCKNNGFAAAEVIQNEINYIYADVGYSFINENLRDRYGSRGYLDLGYDMCTARSLFSDIQRENVDMLHWELERLIN